MKRKITLLIIAAIIGLIALSAIQAYLILNTYKLKKESFVNNSLESTSRIDDSFPKMDSISKIWHTQLLQLVVAYRKGEIAQDSILPTLKSKAKPLDKAYTSVYHEVNAKNQVYSELKFQKRLTAIIILLPIKGDTLFSSQNSSKFHLLGDDFELEEAHRIGRTSSHSEYTFDYEKQGGKITETLRFRFETEDYMNFEDWEESILNEMKGLLLSSLAIFILVFGLLFYSIKNLVTQKKIADIKSDFINNISHEFKTPLATLSLATQMLKTQARTQPELSEETVQIIERQNQRLQKLTDQVLNESLGYQEIQLHKQAVQAHQFLATVIDDFILSINKNQVQISKRLDLNNETVFIDKFHLTTALFNIFENAVKYGGEEIHLHCEAMITDNTFSIVIQDNGLGISPQDLPSVFDKFYRVGNKEIHDVKGLGLGLYYTKQIIKAHQGEIQVESELKHGTIFNIQLPLM